MNSFQKNRSNNWTFLNMTQWIEPALNDSKNWTRLFQHDSENCFFLNLLKFFFYWTRRIEPFLFNTTQRIEPLFKMWLFFNDLKNWTSFFFFGKITQRIGLDSKTWWLPDLKLLSWIMTLFFEKKKLLKELDQIFWLKELFLLYDSKNCTLFLWIWRKELNPFSLNMTQRIEPFENDAENWTLFLFCRKELKLFPLCRK